VTDAGLAFSASGSRSVRRSLPVHPTGAPRNRHNLRDKGNLLFTIVNKNLQFAKAPADWKRSCTHTECTLHQIAPYVGKLKSSIARSLIQRYSKKGDLVVDPFAGAGTIVLEAALAGRDAFGSDISPYAKVLSNAKLFPPSSLREAIRRAERALTEAAKLP
jgi:DNA modification methylase